jgi:hypothetical protein
MQATMQQLEAEWAEILGRERFNEFLRTLLELSSLGSTNTA